MHQASSKNIENESQDKNIYRSERALPTIKALERHRNMPQILSGGHSYQQPLPTDPYNPLAPLAKNNSSYNPSLNPSQNPSQLQNPYSQQQKYQAKNFHKIMKGVNRGPIPARDDVIVGWEDISTERNPVNANIQRSNPFA